MTIETDRKPNDENDLKPMQSRWVISQRAEGTRSVVTRQGTAKSPTNAAPAG
jgi:hypothetical protein